MRAVKGLRNETISPARQVFDCVGAFLFDQRLEPNPVNYAFAFHVVTDPESALAAAVASLTDGGVRLTQRDIEDLGVDLDPQRPEATSEATPEQAADRLVAQTQMHVEGFADMMAALQTETRDFGRDLVASVDAIHESRGHVGQTATFFDDVTRITATMIGRVHDAERRLEQATHETSELRKKLEEARGDALRDPLTGLPNRRALEEAYAAAAASGTPACIAVCDVDHFKQVNDRFGHAVGDRVLRAIAQSLMQACDGHFVARYGGEEFALLLHGAPAEAVAIVEQARELVAEKRYRLRETDAPLGAITFSAGVTAASHGEALGTAFHRADRLLYAAKADGRNRVIFDGDISR